MRTHEPDTDQAGWVRLDDAQCGGSAEGVVALAATALDDAQVWGTSWEGDQLRLSLLVPGATGTVSRTSVLYREAVVVGTPLEDVVRRSILSGRVEQDGLGGGRHRIWLWPESELDITFSDAELVCG